MALTWNLRRYISSDYIYCEGECLSSDTKPTTSDVLFNGSKLIEMDTGKVYIYDAANKVWREFA